MATRERDTATSPFGARLRYWRRERGLSQLSLALSSGTTSRHVSYLETGRSRPSREMVLRLSEALDIALRERNQLLHSAGLAGVYREQALDAADLRPFQVAIERLLRAHEPYPAIAVDRHWNVVSANRPSSTLFGDKLLGANMVRRYYGDPSHRDMIVNWPDVAWAGLVRLRQQLRNAPADTELQALVALAEASTSEIPRPDPPADQLVVCPRFRSGDEIIRTIAITARFDTAVEVTLDELHVELTYPEDAIADRFFRQMSGAGADTAV